MSKNKKTYYLLILDKSGSMSSIALETVEGFNEQVQMIKNLQKKYPEQEILVSLTTFNHEIFEDLSRVRPEQISEMHPARSYRPGNGHPSTITYSPDGMTALYDAIGRSVNKLNNKIKKEIKKDQATAVVVIMTDGHENSSREYTYEQIRKMIAKLEKSDNWTFSYLGSTPDAVDIAKGMNIREHNAMNFSNHFIKDSYCQLNSDLDYYMERKRRGEKPKKFLQDKD